MQFLVNTVVHRTKCVLCSARNIFLYCKMNYISPNLFVRKGLRAVIMGPPGSGKGTISSRITQEYEVQHVSSGDILRNGLNQNTVLSESAKRYMSSGQLVPDHIMKQLMLSQLQKMPHDSHWLLDGKALILPCDIILYSYRSVVFNQGSADPQGFLRAFQGVRGVVGGLLTNNYKNGDRDVKGSVNCQIKCLGFPRTVEQAMYLDDHHLVDAVIYLDVPYDTIKERLCGRWVHLPSGRVYNNDFNPPLELGYDDVTGEPLTQRHDDRPETVHKRLLTYEQATKPLLDYYRDKNG